MSPEELQYCRAMVTRPALRALLSISVVVLAGCELRCAPTCNADVDVATPSDHHDVRTGPAAEGGSVGAAGECSGPTRSGTTSCFPGECPPGQYCDDTGMATCRPGCASDASCGPREICVREGDAALGRCESCASHTAHEPAPGCVVPARTGVTSCFPGECPVGQRCVDEGMPHCEPGCASDESCGPAEYCLRKPGAALGVCRSCYYD